MARIFFVFQPESSVPQYHQTPTTTVTQPTPQSHITTTTAVIQTTKQTTSSNITTTTTVTPLHQEPHHTVQLVTPHAHLPGFNRQALPQVGCSDIPSQFVHFRKGAARHWTHVQYTPT